MGKAARSSVLPVADKFQASAHLAPGHTCKQSKYASSQLSGSPLLLGGKLGVTASPLRSNTTIPRGGMQRRPPGAP